MTRVARQGFFAVWVATLTALACGGDEGQVRPLDEGVSWALAELRVQTLSDVSYTYHLRVPRALDAPLEGTLVADFLWSDGPGERPGPGTSRTRRRESGTFG